VVGKVEPVFIPEVTDLATVIADFVQDGDVVLTMGAGSVGQVPVHLAAMGEGA
jgi:UDP-N-acetylmuramate--alanine ligase